MEIKRNISINYMIFTKQEKIVANYFINTDNMLSATELSKRLNVNQMTITRFCKKMGYKNYNEFIHKFKQSELEDHIDNSSNIHLSTLNDIYSGVDKHVLKDFVEDFKKSKRIYLIAISQSTYTLNEYKKLFNSYDKFVTIISDHNHLFHELLHLQEDSLILNLSMSGENKITKTLSDYNYQNNIALYLLSTNTKIKNVKLIPIKVRHSLTLTHQISYSFIYLIYLDIIKGAFNENY